MRTHPAATPPVKGPFASTIAWTLPFIALVALALAGTSLLGGTYSDEVLKVHFYQSFWYRGLVVALCALTLVCLSKPRRLSAGFVLTHLAFVLLCLAAILGSHFELRARLTLRQGETGNQLYAQDGTPSEALPFHVRLNRFQIEHYPPQPRLLRLSGEKILQSTPARTGEVLASGACRVTVLGETAGDAAPANPALKVRVRDLADGSTRENWLFARFPDFGTPGAAHGNAASGAPDAPRLLYLHPDDGPESLAVGFPDRLMATYPVALDSPFVVAALSAEVTVLQSFHDFMIEGGEPRNRPVAPDPLIRLRIDDGTGAPPTESTLRQGEPIELPASAGVGNSLVWDASPGMIKDFYSDLSVLRDGREWARTTIEVNHPLQFEGYRFYQTNYDDEGFTYTVLEVVRDPWLPLFYIGAGLMVLGTAILCFDPRKGRG